MTSLTPKQNAVTKILKQHSYVCSLPGSGKTHVSVELALNILNADQSNTLLIVTFTRSGAGEMRKRIGKHLSKEQKKRLKVATIDACIVHMAKTLLGKGKFRLLMGADHTLALIRIARELNYPDISEVSEILDYYLSAISIPMFQDIDHKAIYDCYQDILKSKYLPTYDLKTLANFVVKSMELGNILPFDFSHIIVDEYQDTSAIQYSWVAQHALIRKSVIIGVGDDDQAIYRFAGAKGYDNFLNLKNDFNATGYALDTCFRCAPNILQYGASVIKMNKFRVEKEFNSLESLKGGQIRIHHHNNLSHDILPHIEKNKSDIAILSRNNSTLDEIEVALVGANIDYQRISGRSGLLSNHNAISLVRLLNILMLNEDITNLPTVLGWLGESEHTLGLISSYINREHPKKLSDINLDEFDLSGGSSTINSNQFKWSKNVSGRDVKTRLVDIIEYITTFLHQPMDRFTLISMADFIYKKMKGDSLIEKLKSVNELLNSVMSGDDELNKDVVTLSTLHSGKGLEWATVWIVDASEGAIPSPMKESPVEAKNNAELHIEDERRLFYVGITRAERELNISYKKYMGQFLATSNLKLTKILDADGTEIIIEDCDKSIQST